MNLNELNLLKGLIDAELKIREKEQLITKFYKDTEFISVEMNILREELDKDINNTKQYIQNLEKENARLLARVNELEYMLSINLP
jgi:DNA-binding response OmpR family regulator